MNEVISTIFSAFLKYLDPSSPLLVITLHVTYQYLCEQYLKRKFPIQGKNIFAAFAFIASYVYLYIL